jgi:hypothetical protein
MNKWQDTVSERSREKIPRTKYKAAKPEPALDLSVDTGMQTSVIMNDSALIVDINSGNSDFLEGSLADFNLDLADAELSPNDYDAMAEQIMNQNVEKLFRLHESRARRTRKETSSSDNSSPAESESSSNPSDGARGSYPFGHIRLAALEDIKRQLAGEIKKQAAEAMKLKQEKLDL